MKNRPVLSIPHSKLEIVNDVVSIIIIAIVFITLATSWSHLPEIIPTHFNGLGEPDGWGGKGSLLLVPIMSLLLYIGLTVLSKYPHRFNYLSEITVHNAERQYKNARMMLSWMKVEIVALLGSLHYIAIQASMGNGAGLWPLPLILSIVLLITIVYYVIRSMRMV